MATKQAVYRFRDGVTPLSADTFNTRFSDVDARLGGLEAKTIDWDAAFGVLRDLGLSRLADLLVQLNQQAQAAEAAQQTAYEAHEATRDAASAAALVSANAALAAAQQGYNTLAAALNNVIQNNEGAGATLAALQVWRDLLNPPHDGFVWGDRLRDGPSTITYNQDGTIAHIDATLPGNHTYRQAYTYGGDGSVATVVATLGAVTLWTRTYTYDQAGTLTGWTEA
jgi:hypothetical protein